MVPMDHPLLADREWEFSTMVSATTKGYVFENDQHYRWLVTKPEDAPKGYRQISDRYYNVQTWQVENRYIDDPVSQDISKYISISTESVIKTNIKTGETRKFYACQSEFSDRDWVVLKGNNPKVVCYDPQGNRRLVPGDVIPEGWKRAKKQYGYFVNKEGMYKRLEINDSLDSLEWTSVSKEEYNNAKHKKLTSEQRSLIAKARNGASKKNVITGETRFICKDDPLYNDPNWKGTKHGKVNIKNIHTGEIICVPIDDPRRSTGDWVTLAYGRAAYRNIETGEQKMLCKDDPELLSGKWVSTSKGWSTFRNKVTGEKASFGKDDPRYHSDEWVLIYKGINDIVPDKVCPYCGTICHHGKGYSRWHGDNCKKNPNNNKSNVV